MKIANWALAVALSCAVLTAPSEPKTAVKIDCLRETAGKYPVCEIKRASVSRRPDLFHGVKAKPKVVHL